jgi:hypothetical protein
LGTTCAGRNNEATINAGTRTLKPPPVPRWRLLVGAAVAVCVFAIAAGCATTQSRYEFLADHYPPRAADASVEIFRSGIPQVPFKRIARLDVHLEKSGFVKPTFEEALPELKKQARQAGADAIIEIEERPSQILETMVLHVTATGVRYVSAQ